MIFSQTTKLNECLDFSLSGKNQIIFGLGEGERSFFAGLLNKKKVIVVSDFIAANTYKSQLLALGQKAEIIYGGIETPVYVYWQDTAQTQHLIRSLSGFLNNELDAIILLADALTTRLGKKENFLPKVINIGQILSRKNLIDYLIFSGYKASAFVSSEGEYSVRGDIIDIFIPQEQLPVRINFFDDEIESLHYYNIENMAKEKDIESINIYPCTIFFNTNYDDITVKMQNQLKNLTLDQTAFDKIQDTIESVSQAVLSNPTSLNLAFTTVFQDEMVNNILDLVSDCVLILDQPNKIAQMLELIYSSFNNNTLSLVSQGVLTKMHFDYLINPNNVFKSVSSLSTIVFDDINSNQNVITPQKSTTFSSLSPVRYLFDFKTLAYDIKKYQLSAYKVVLYTGSEESQEKIKEFLISNGLSISDDKFVNDSASGVFVLNEYLFKSVLITETKTVLIATEDLIKTKAAKFSSKKKSVFYLPKVGEYIVHEFHGVGKCVAIERLKLANYEKDYFVLQYEKGDKIYIPTEQANTISAYVGNEEEPKVNKLGGLEFARVKARARKSIEELAVNLMELYAKREGKKGFQFESDSYLQQAFEAAFEFEETPDQLQAISDIKQDMESTKIMERLICGDVGYGKTEVALRAAYKAVLSGKQVAILCPTTILSEQHYKTCKKRFKEFMVNIQRINRLITPAHQKQTLSKLKEGNLDIIVGTHRLLAKDIVFKDLGLLILDEEQRFGVQDKEKIKLLKENIDVLTLSATPIPRTLHMSLTGIRDISIIETPPKGRVAVQTFVTEFDWSLIENVIRRELSRQGQIYVVFNRVERISDFAAEISALFPGVKVGVAHGQMDRKTLEETVLKLYNGEFGILVATTLIENGIDISNANTLIIVDSDKLGLSSLYQLKGRVGRSGRLAYAYFTYQKNKVLSETALKRLKAISEFSSLGSGFKIAMRDMEIRGAGSVLGNKQHGHIEKVGYDLYSKILQEVMEEKKGNKHIERKPIKLDIAVNAFLPDNFVSDENLRIKLYTDISMLETKEQYNQILKQTEETYGQVPKEVESLCKIALIKNIASLHDVKAITINKDIATIQLYKKEEILNDFLARALEKNKNVSVLKFQILPIIEFEKLFVSAERKLNLVFEFFTD
jgi:transcription-repair coupling factor (superfamily II helicase)